MGREVRRVKEDWQHPSNDRGLIALYDGSYSKEKNEWEEGKAEWANGFRRKYGNHENIWQPIEEEYRDQSFEEWDGEMPNAEDYMPDWSEEERTHYQMYENVSEGTPLSPVFDEPEKLAQWLYEKKANAGAGAEASYEGWLRVCLGGYAPSMIIENGVIKNGVD